MFTSTTTSEYSNSIGIKPLVMEKATTKWKYNSFDLAPNCPRCASSNTKFCYYNNYSLSQPRYLCKGCRRYWTKGGSLRNVPVGGGCRRSRRARPARQGGGTNYAGPTRSPTCNVGCTDDSNSGTYIDMAAVFAKYVSQNVESEESSSPGASSGSSDNVQASSLDIDSQLEEITMFEYQRPLDLINGADDQIQQVIPQFSMCQDITGQDFVYQDSNAFELQQGVLGDGLAADILWSDGSHGTTLPNFGLQQPMLQVEDLGLYSPDDQLRISANLVTENWGSFDLSACEFYSIP